ncbi:MAG: hypothetical protein DWQ19_12945 [Crenarchaeota archaeon]|nr:MAG: hypothetical protein DWQ19_12945 [Thermoproteota archaeon]
MSTYAVLVGDISYKDYPSYENVVNFLRRGGWLNKDDLFVAEYGTDPVCEESTLNPDGLIIQIPRAYYRNLAAHLEILSAGSISSLFIWATTDGQYQGGVWNDGNETLYDLTEWAKDPDQAVDLLDNPDDELPDEPEFWNDVVELFVDTFDTIS